MNLTETTQMSSSQLSGNRIKQVQYLCAMIKETKTSVPYIVDPDKFNAPVEKEHSGSGWHEDAVKTFFKYQKQYMSELNNFSEYLNISLIEAFVFCLIFEKQVGEEESSVAVYEINSYLGIDGIEGLPFRDICDKLCEMHYIKRIICKRDGDISYYIVESVIDSIRHNEQRVTIDLQEKIDKYQFCKIASESINSIDKMLTLTKSIRMLEEQNQHLEFIDKLKSLDFDINDRMLFYETVNACINDNKQSLSSICEEIYCEQIHKRIRAIKEIKNGSNRLIQHNILEVSTDSFFDNTILVLSDNGLDFFFGDDKIAFTHKHKNSNNLISDEEIPIRELFFDKELSSDISFIENCLSVEEFKKLQDRLTSMSMSKGVAVLFYGSPGSGKTETVMQIARKTNRKVYKVDISACKTCWYGESEKLIKQLFTTYQQMCKIEENTPILLFNEADALLSKRRNNISSSSDQSDNAIQNILLEEIEKLDGIMFATTNFECNLDDAFERRFLMKINFNKPSIKSQEAIWHNKIPQLSLDDCRSLAVKFNLSGGEIDNVVRKLIMLEVLNKEKPNYETICLLCSKEKLLNTERKHIGYKTIDV